MSDAESELLLRSLSCISFLLNLNRPQTYSVSFEKINT